MTAATTHPLIENLIRQLLLRHGPDRMTVDVLMDRHKEHVPDVILGLSGKLDLLGQLGLLNERSEYIWQIAQIGLYYADYAQMAVTGLQGQMHDDDGRTFRLVTKIIKIHPVAMPAAFAQFGAQQWKVHEAVDVLEKIAELAGNNPQHIPAAIKALADLHDTVHRSASEKALFLIAELGKNHPEHVQLAVDTLQATNTHMAIKIKRLTNLAKTSEAAAAPALNALLNIKAAFNEASKPTTSLDATIINTVKSLTRPVILTGYLAKNTGDDLRDALTRAAVAIPALQGADILLDHARDTVRHHEKLFPAKLESL